MNTAVECAERGDYKSFWASCDGSLNDWLMSYWQAICLFKGFGCEKDQERGACIAQKIIPEILKEAENDDVVALHKIGVLYAQGCGVEKDDARAVVWYRKAAERGYVHAQYNLCLMYAKGRGIEQNNVIASDWCRQAAKQGHSKAQSCLGRMYETGRGVEKDDAVAVTWYRKAAEQGHVGSQYKLGVMYANGRGVEKDDTVAVEWYRKAAEQGDALSQCSLGLMYENGRGVEKDDLAAVEWYRKAAGQGIVVAQFILGLMYSNGRGVIKDESQAVGWFRKAAEQGNARAQFNLGVMYANGRGVEKDDVVAVEWFRKAAKQGYMGSQYNLGVMYANGRGVEKDDAVAVEWYRKAAVQGDALAQFNLGVMYANGRGVEKDDVVAVEWFRKAAKQGYMGSQYNLGVMYANGRGVEKDDAVAVEWYRKAAVQGDALAQYNLGVKYQSGHGVAKNVAVAAEWYRKAADGGCLYARERLDKIFQPDLMKDDYGWTLRLVCDNGESFVKSALHGNYFVVSCNEDLARQFGFVWKGTDVKIGMRLSAEFIIRYRSVVSQSSGRVQVIEIHFESIVPMASLNIGSECLAGLIQNLKSIAVNGTCVSAVRIPHLRDGLIYHMTDITNLESILINGILSKNLARQYQAQRCDIADGRIQERRDLVMPFAGRCLHDYASFYFNPRNAMMYRVSKHEQRDVVVLGVAACAFEGTDYVVSDKNAAARGVRFGATQEFVDGLRWDIVFSRSWSQVDGDVDKIKQVMQSELLVPDCVNSSFVVKIYCRDQDMVKFVQSVCKRFRHHAIVTCDPDMFFCG